MLEGGRRNQQDSLNDNEKATHGYGQEIIIGSEARPIVHGSYDNGDKRTRVRLTRE